MDWLLVQPHPVSTDVDRVLMAHLTAAPKAIFGAAINTALICSLSYLVTLDPIFLIGGLLQVPAYVYRVRAMAAVQKAFAENRDLPIRRAVVSGIVWCTLQGLVALTTLLEEQPGVAVLGTCMIMAVIGSIGARNFAAPRYAMALIFAANFGFLTGCVARGDFLTMAIVALAPPFLRGQHQMVLANNKVLVSALAAEIESRDRARRDALTGLLNLHGYSIRRDDIETAHPGTFHVLCLDLDGFKDVNDRYGHPAGDELLRQVGRRIADTISANDLAARIGGDEFVVVHVSDRGSAAALADRLIQTIMRSYDLGEGRTVGIGVSIGVALNGEDGRTLDDLRRQADAALYRAKREGKGAWRRVLRA